jgi:hypothetical protein
MSDLAYTPASVPEDCVQKISPSSFAKFITTPWSWYRQQILELDKFEYSTASVIGTIVHYCAEQVASNKDVDEDAIEKYIKSFEEKDDYAINVVEANWYEMAAVLINEYVTAEMDSYIGIEKQVCQNIGSNFYVAGTLDALQGHKNDCLLTDYKTYSSKTKPKAIPADYRYQLLTYSMALRKAGYNVTRIRLVYVNRRIDGGVSEKTGKPLKSYPPEVVVLTETITNEDIDFITGMLDLCKDTVLACIKHPELVHVITHDPRNKPEN